MNKSVLGKKPVSFLKAVVVFAVVSAFFVPVSSLVSVETFDDTIVSIIPDAQSVNKGETFNVSIRVKPGEPIMGISVGILSFDPTLLHLNSVTEGDIFDPYDTFISGIVNNTNGTVSDIYGNASLSNATTNPGYFCNISFTSQEKIGTSILDLDDVVVTNISGVEVPVIVNNGEVAIGWSVTLDFDEDSGNYDYVIFGELTTANDGSPHDSYDTPKSPAPMEPYIRAWFDDNLSAPYGKLLNDYRQYPDAKKTWDLYAQWKDDSPTHTTITISWNASEFIGCEYNSVVLTRLDEDEKWEFAADMLTEEEYTYTPRWFGVQWLTDHFQINAIMDITPPEITNVTMTTSDPIDTDPVYGWENVTCTVIDDGVGIDEVKLVLTYPNSTTEVYPMIKDGDTYSYETSLTIVGDYTYHIWADDNIDNIAQSTSNTFIKPPNCETDMDFGTRIIEFWDLVEVVKHYGETGTPGWIREDVNNNGEVEFWDLVEIVKSYGDIW